MIEDDRNWEPTTGSVPTGWFRLAVRYLGTYSGVEIYIDGNLAGSYYNPRTFASDYYQPNEGKLVFGRYYTDDGSYSSALIDEFIVYDEVLIPSQIANL